MIFYCGRCYKDTGRFLCAPGRAHRFGEKKRKGVYVKVGALTFLGGWDVDDDVKGFRASPLVVPQFYLGYQAMMGDRSSFAVEVGAKTLSLYTDKSDGWFGVAIPVGKVSFSYSF